MTTIIVIVVVALVFFVSICVAAFMVWKRESEIRTDSIRAIELKLERLGADLTENTDAGLSKEETQPESFEREFNQSRVFRQRSRDPFSWMRTQVAQEQDTGKTGSELFEDELLRNTEVHSEKDYASNDNGIVETELEEYAINSVNSVPNEKDSIYADIDLDFAEIRNLVSEIRDTDEEQSSEEAACLHELTTEELPETDRETSDGDMEAFTEVKKSPISHNVGKSGKKYTAEELETLIKE